jgi:hypothetical protein
MTGRPSSLFLGQGLLFFALTLLALAALSPRAVRADDDPEPSSRFPKTDADDRRRSENNLKHIGLALHCYHDVYGAMPDAAIRDAKGKALLSWRVAILPYVEQGNLYNQFKLDEPWDSKHNKKLLDSMPDLFAPTVQGKKGKTNATYYQVFTGPDTMFDPKAARGSGAATLNLRLTQITDGTSHTAMVVEAAKPVPWTKPDDLAYDAKKPLPKLGGLFREGYHVVFADGSIRMVARSAKERDLRAMITPNGGEKFSPDDLPKPAKK